MEQKPEPRAPDGAADGAPPWYAAGLRFGCARSGRCCSGPPGRVWFEPDELQAMARAVGLLPFQFVDRYARRLNGRLSLRETPGPGGAHDCVFLTRDADGRAGCRVYEARPRQCRTWPFWPEILRDPAAWEAAGRRCPGIDRGARVEREEIERRRDDTPLP